MFQYIVHSLCENIRTTSIKYSLLHFLYTLRDYIFCKLLFSNLSERVNKACTRMNEKKMSKLFLKYNMGIRRASENLICLKRGVKLGIL